jgi:CSLREA domain-containing protein
MSASRGVVAALVALVAALAMATSAGAKTYEVNKRSDHAPNGCKKKDCTLREAVLAANARDGSDRIVLPERKTYNLSIENTDPGEDEAATGDLDITDFLRVTHPGKGRAKVDANDTDRVFELLNGGSTTFKKIVVRGGDDTDIEVDPGGGGIQVHQADLVLRRSSVSGNHADGSYGGGIELNGDENASFTMVRSALSGNSSESDSGALEAGGGPVAIERSKVIGNTSGGFAGALYLDTSEPNRIVNSTISGNRANSAGGIGGYGPLTIENSTIANNRALTGEAGGVDIDDSDSSFVLRNSTFAGNSADGNGGGLAIGDVSRVQANAVTIVRNSSDGNGGGVFNDADDPVEFQNSLIALNSVEGVGEDCANGPNPDDDFDSLGHNLLSELDTDSCEGFDASGDLVNSNPKLGKLKRNGGPTQTVALKKGSPAINKAAKSAPNKDQRGEKRGKKPDIGAYERVKKKKGKKRR